MHSSISSPDKIISCDWGSSRFRLRLVNTTDGRILEDLTTADGIAVLRKNLNSDDPALRRIFLLRFLNSHIKMLPGGVSENVPVVISGMASSTIGIKELGYAPLPFSATGSDVLSEWLSPSDVCPHPVLLISGVCSANDVMRGEETQLIGLQQSADPDNAITRVYLFPGTHSKHLYVSGNQIIRLQTFITGEMFSILQQHSILKDSITGSKSEDLDDRTKKIFLEGVKTSGESGLLHTVFSVRTNVLFNRFSKEENFYYLSGLLIGAELRNINPSRIKLILCAGKSLHSFYLAAIEALQLLAHTEIISSQKADYCTVAGQLAILKQKKLSHE